MSYEHDNSNYDKSEIYSQKIWYSQQIRKICDRKHVGIAELSLYSGLSEEYLQKILAAEVMPSANTLRSIALALNVSVDLFTKPKY